MDKINIVLIDDSLEFCRTLEQSFKLYYSDEICVVGTAHDGKEGIRLITREMPDVAIIDICMPGMDGVQVVESVKRAEETKRVSCVMLSGVSTDFSVTASSVAGADYIFAKPFNIERLAKCVIAVCEYKKRAVAGSPSAKRGANPQHLSAFAPVPEKFAVSVLLDMGFSANNKGFLYLKSAITYCVDDANCMEMLTKLLYPRVAAQYGSSASRAERSMRTSIASAWGSNQPGGFTPVQYIDTYFPARPTVGAFLRQITDGYLRLYHVTQ